MRDEGQVSAPRPSLIPGFRPDENANVPGQSGPVFVFFYSKDAIFIFIMSLHHARVFFASPVVSVASLRTSFVVLEMFYSQRIDIFQLAY